MINKISTEELKMIDFYRYNFAVSSSDGVFCSLPPTETVLKEWEIQKSKFLQKLFGDKLIHSINLEYNKPLHYLNREIDLFLFGKDNEPDYSSYSIRMGETDTSHITHDGERFYHKMLNKITDIRFENSSTISSWYNCDQEAFLGLLDNLFVYKGLRTNIYEGPKIKVYLPKSDVTLRVDSGMKLTKILSKLAKEFDLEADYEQFRLAHSEILGGAKLKGKLSLSIHPLDYLTMSDNNSDWTSCMSWSDVGGYRQGTVEMMNAPDVIVAYVESDRKLPIGDYEWNSKKWRQLFVVKESLIAGIKGYPYSNKSLARQIIDFLRELGKKNLNLEYEVPREIEVDNEEDIEEMDAFGDFKVIGSCSDLLKSADSADLPNHSLAGYFVVRGWAMYNDFGLATNRKHFIALNYHEIAQTYLRISYGGTPMCMICGELLWDDPYRLFDTGDSSKSLVCCKDCVNNYLQTSVRKAHSFRGGMDSTI